MSSLTYRFVTLDYIVVSIALGFTAAVGFYYVLKASRSKNTREFLVTNRNLGLVPIIMSAAATALNAGNLLATPMQGYANGVQMMVGYVGFLMGLIATAYATMPVLYKLNVNTINQYVEYRFNRFLRIFPGFAGLLQSSFIIAGVTYITALVFTQATGLEIHLSIALLGGLCIVYSSLGGFTAVVWTDVFQMLIICATFALMAVKGTIDAGGVGNVWEKNGLGNRTTFAHFTPVSYSGYTVWSLVIGEFAISFCHSASSQAQLQRQLASKTIAGARRTIVITAVITQILSFVAVWIGMSAFARYFRCDPVVSGQIDSIDQIVPQFAMDMFQSTPGLFGLYVAGILCATLSTLSSIVNSFTAVVLIDFIKPLMPNTPDNTSKALSKIIGIFYGLFIMVLSAVFKYFGNFISVAHTIGGTSLGTNSGIYLLGFFFPWATAKGTTIGYFVGLSCGWYLAFQRFRIGNPYIMGPVSADGCNDTTPFGHHSNQSLPFAITTPTSECNTEPESFALHDIIPIWYAPITLCITVGVGLVVSFLTGPTDISKLDPNLISPLIKRVYRKLPKRFQERVGLAVLLANKQPFVPPIDELKDRGTTSTELINYQQRVQLMENGNQSKEEPETRN